MDILKASLIQKITLYHAIHKTFTIIIKIHNIVTVIIVNSNGVITNNKWMISHVLAFVSIF